MSCFVQLLCFIMTQSTLDGVGNAHQTLFAVLFWTVLSTRVQTWTIRSSISTAQEVWEGALGMVPSMMRTHVLIADVAVRHDGNCEVFQKLSFWPVIDGFVTYTLTRGVVYALGLCTTCG